jgi:hypothetical protein
MQGLQTRIVGLPKFRFEQAILMRIIVIVPLSVRKKTGRRTIKMSVPCWRILIS